MLCKPIGGQILVVYSIVCSVSKAGRSFSLEIIDIYRRSVTEGGCKIRSKGSDTGQSGNAVVMHTECYLS